MYSLSHTTQRSCTWSGHTAITWTCISFIHLQVILYVYSHTCCHHCFYCMSLHITVLVSLVVSFSALCVASASFSCTFSSTSSSSLFSPWFPPRPPLVVLPLYSVVSLFSPLNLPSISPANILRPLEVIFLGLLPPSSAHVIPSSSHTPPSFASTFSSSSSSDSFSHSTCYMRK